MPQIVVPLDGSPLAETILPQAAALARTTSATLTLLHVIPPFTMLAANMTIPENWYDEQLAWARSYLADTARRVMLEQEVDVQTQVFEGDPAGQIIDYVEKHADVTLLAMATHGLTGAYRWVIGSVAAKVLHATQVPLLLLHASPEQKAGTIAYRNILVPLDGTAVAERALDEAARIARSANATLLLHYVVHDSSESAASDYLERTAQRLREQGVLVQTQVTSGNPAEEIARLSHERRINLVVMITHARTGLQRLALGSIAEHVLQHSAIPVLLVHVRD